MIGRCQRPTAWCLRSNGLANPVGFHVSVVGHGLIIHVIGGLFSACTPLQGRLCRAIRKVDARCSRVLGLIEGIEPKVQSVMQPRVYECLALCGQSLTWGLEVSIRGRRHIGQPILPLTLAPSSFGLAPSSLLCDI